MQPLEFHLELLRSRTVREEASIRAEISNVVVITMKQTDHGSSPLFMIFLKEAFVYLKSRMTDRQREREREVLRSSCL